MSKLFSGLFDANRSQKQEENSNTIPRQGGPFFPKKFEIRMSKSETVSNFVLRFSDFPPDWVAGRLRIVQ